MGSEGGQVKNKLHLRLSASLLAMHNQHSFIDKHFVGFFK